MRLVFLVTRRSSSTTESGCPISGSFIARCGWSTVTFPGSHSSAAELSAISLALYPIVEKAASCEFGDGGFDIFNRYRWNENEARFANAYLSLCQIKLEILNEALGCSECEWHMCTVIESDEGSSKPPLLLNLYFKRIIYLIRKSQLHPLPHHSLTHISAGCHIWQLHRQMWVARHYIFRKPQIPP